MVSLVKATLFTHLKSEQSEQSDPGGGTLFKLQKGKLLNRES